ncbi:MAG: hypothetical protein ABIT16_04495 [Croceibacterium sp.]
MTRREVGRLVMALLLGAAVALPVGMMLADQRTAPAGSPHALPAPTDHRAVFSPKVLSDPYFLDQQRKGIEALEQNCRRTGAMCDEARQGRAWLERQGQR